MNILAIVSLILYLNFATAETVLTETLQYVEGSKVTINCNAAVYNESTKVYWMKGISQYVYQDGARLEFTTISRNDSGNYTCHGNKASISGLITVDVTYPAEITQFIVKPLDPLENTTFSITCYMEGNPPPTWEVRNNRTNAVLFQSHEARGITLGQIEAICYDDSDYICTGFNKLSRGHNVTKGQNVHIMCPPRSRVPYEQNQHEAYVGLGMRAFLFENMMGYPTPTYTWSREDGQPMGIVEKLSYPGLAYLNVPTVQLSDYGNYTLTANNSLGTFTSEFRIIPLGQPQTPGNLTASDVTDTSVNLKWTCGFDMGGSMTFYLFSWTMGQWKQVLSLIHVTGEYPNHGIGLKWAYKYTGLQPAMQYTLSVAAKGRMFWSNKSNRITFTTHDSRFAKSTPAIHDHGAASKLTAHPSIFIAILTVVFLHLISEQC